MDGDQLHVLATIGQLVEGRPSGHGQIDLEIKARRADRQLGVTRRNLLACTFDRLFDGLRQGRSMRRPITRRQRRCMYKLVGPPIGFPNAVVAKVDMGAVARKIVCHYDLCCRYSDSEACRRSFRASMSASEVIRFPPRNMMVFAASSAARVISACDSLSA